MQFNFFFFELCYGVLFEKNFSLEESHTFGEPQICFAPVKGFVEIFLRKPFSINFYEGCLGIKSHKNFEC
jgi:hypothetical protein